MCRAYVALNFPLKACPDATKTILKFFNAFGKALDLVGKLVCAAPVRACDSACLLAASDAIACHLSLSSCVMRAANTLSSFMIARPIASTTGGTTLLPIAFKATRRESP